MGVIPESRQPKISKRPKKKVSNKALDGVPKFKRSSSIVALHCDKFGLRESIEKELAESKNLRLLSASDKNSNNSDSNQANRRAEEMELNI